MRCCGVALEMPQMERLLLLLLVMEKMISGLRRGIIFLWIILSLVQAAVGQEHVGGTGELGREAAIAIIASPAPGLPSTSTSIDAASTNTLPPFLNMTALLNGLEKIKNKPILSLCSSGCIQGTLRSSSSKKLRCLGRIEALRAIVRKTRTGLSGSGKQRSTKYFSSANVSQFNHSKLVVHVDTPLLCISSSRTNINHAFHDDLYSALSWFRRPENRNVTILYQVSSVWLGAVIMTAAKAYGWTLMERTDERLQKIGNEDLVAVCSKKAVWLNEFVRDMHKFEVEAVSQMRKELRAVAWSEMNRSTHTRGNRKKGHISSLSAAEASIEEVPHKKEQILIYTRNLDSQNRRLKNATELISLFDLDRFQVSIVDKMPRLFLDQVRLFSNVSLLIAPNGGWAPNVMWLPDDACFVELHLYRIDTWIGAFGLGRIFKPYHFMTLTGHYSYPTIKPRSRPGRIGGDDPILGDRVGPAIRKALLRNKPCTRFLSPLLNSTQTETV